MKRVMQMQKRNWNKYGGFFKWRSISTGVFPTKTGKKCKSKATALPAVSLTEQISTDGKPAAALSTNEVLRLPASAAAYTITAHFSTADLNTPICSALNFSAASAQGAYLLRQKSRG